MLALSSSGSSWKGSLQHQSSASTELPHSSRPSSRVYPALSYVADAEAAAARKAQPKPRRWPGLPPAEGESVWPDIERVGLEGALLLLVASRRISGHFFKVRSQVTVRGTMHVQLGMRREPTGALATPEPLEDWGARRSHRRSNTEELAAPGHEEMGEQSTDDPLSRELGVFVTKLMLKAASFSSSEYSTTRSDGSERPSERPSKRPSISGDGVPILNPADHVSREQAANAKLWSVRATKLLPAADPALLRPKSRHSVWRVEHESGHAPPTIRCGGLGEFELSDELPAWLTHSGSAELVAG
ncbi:hypothetical protein T492DRAFT_1051778, partial [Pavlovales sp. CCMP2436]